MDVDRLPTLEQTLADAEQLLIYASEAGIDVAPEISQRIIAAQRAGDTVWNGPDAGALMAAIAKLAATVRPVTAQTLAACRTIARQEIVRYTFVAIALAFLIVPLSILSFITSGLSNSIAADLRTANDLAVTLHTDLDSPQSTPRGAATNVTAPASSLASLQQFAATIRSVKEHAAQLDHFVYGTRIPGLHRSDADYELDPKLANNVSALQNETNAKTAVYQDVRRYAIDVQNAVTLYYGAIATFILPMLYALLGACAFLLRLFSRELQSGSFSNRYDISARFFVALIGGMIVGLFNNFTVTGATLSPLALAFLVGYAADVFFSFLESLLQNFKKAA